MTTETTPALRKWTATDAGPIQIKRIQKALSAVRSRGTAVRELWGVRGESEHTSIVTKIGDPCRPEVLELLGTVGERYDYTITRRTAPQILADLEALLPQIELPTEDRRRDPEEARARDEAAKAARAEREAVKAARESAWKKITAKAPPGSTAVILAEYERDDCDSMSDYFATKTERVCVIGFRTGSRESFATLRKAAACFPPTAHLGPDRDLYTVRHVSTADDPASNRYKGSYVPFGGDLHGSTFSTEGEARAAIESADTLPDCEWIIDHSSIEHRDNYSGGAGNYLKAGGRYSTGWAVRSRPLGAVPYLDFEDQLPAAIEPGEAESFSIVEIFHEKRGCPVFIVAPARRLPETAFSRLRSSCRLAGGWYSRKWGSSPSGFAFKSEEAAKLWAAQHLGTATVPSAASPADTFDDLADRLAQDARVFPRKENTPKQRKQAASARFDASNAQHATDAARALAAGYRAGDLPADLRSIRPTLGELRDLTRRTRDHSREGYYDVIPTDNLASDDPRAEALRRYVNAPDRSEALRSENRAAELPYVRIPGFFPTPADVASDLVGMLPELDHSARILEPSAGRGDLCYAIENRFGPGCIECVEINPELRDLCASRWCVLSEPDFLALEPTPTYDAVVMNPPYEKGADRAHVLHALRFLRPGGTLVALVSPSTPGNADFLFSLSGLPSLLAFEFGDPVSGFAATAVRPVPLTVWTRS